jgi:hypothetical protein
MDFDYTEYEYLPECSDGCGAITDWMSSNDAAHEVALSHEKQTGHHWQVQQRMKELPEDALPVTQKPLDTTK